MNNNSLNTVIMKMSHAYDFQTFYRNSDFYQIDATDLEGTNCYLEDASAHSLRERIANCPVNGIHFIDSGNYHYLSLLWLEKIQKPISLVLFDFHPDMQPPSFGRITSCGGWVKEVLDDNLLVERVYTCGVKRELLEELEPLSPYVTIGIESLCSSKERKQLYLSIDKDVLGEEDARCDWSQGQMTLDELLSWIDQLAKRHDIIGVDICGDTREAEDTVAQEVNDRTNHLLYQHLSKYL